MGLFDDIIKDQSSVAVANPPTQGGSSGQHDDSFLIIDDETKEVASFVMFDDKPEAKAETYIPTSAEDLIIIDDTPIVENTSSTSAESLLSLDQTTSQAESKDETLELSSLLSKANEDVNATGKQAPSFFAEETIQNVQPIREQHHNNDIEKLMSEESESANLQTFEIKPLEDPNVILDESIARLESLYANHELVKQSKIDKVADINKQITALKKQTSQLGKEIDQINAQQEKVLDVKKVFQSQKAV